MQYLDATSKNDRMILACFQGKALTISVLQVCAPTTDANKAEADQFYEDIQHLPEVTPKKRCPFHHRGLECKSGKSRDIQNNRQIWPWSTKRSRAKANRVLTHEYHCPVKVQTASLLDFRLFSSPVRHSTLTRPQSFHL